MSTPRTDAAPDPLVGAAARYLPAEAVVRGSSVRPQAMAALATAYVAWVRTLVGAGVVGGVLLGIVAAWFGLRQLTSREPSLALGLAGIGIGVALVAASLWWVRGLLRSGRELVRAQQRWFDAAPSLPAPDAGVLGRGPAIARLVVAGLALAGAVAVVVLATRDGDETADLAAAAAGLVVVVVTAALAVSGLLRLHRIGASAPPPTSPDAFAPAPLQQPGGQPGASGQAGPYAGYTAPYGGPGATTAPAPWQPQAGPAPAQPAAPAPWQSPPAASWQPQQQPYGGQQQPYGGQPGGPSSPARRHETITWAERPAAPLPAAPPSPSSPPPPADPDGDTESTRLTQAAAAAVVADTTTRSGRTEIVVVLQDGRRLPADAVSLLGRDPRARPEELTGSVLPVEHSTVSRTHASFRVTATSVHVTDRASTNGTSVVTPDGARRELRPWAEEPVAVGSEVFLGSFRIRVVLPEDA